MEAKKPGVYLVDVREESEWHAGHAPGDPPRQGHHRARHRAAHSRSRARIVCYCGGGYRSALAVDNLQKMGYTNVVSVDGGFAGCGRIHFTVNLLLAPPNLCCWITSRGSSSITLSRCNILANIIAPSASQPLDFLCLQRGFQYVDEISVCRSVSHARRNARLLRQ